MAQGVKRGEGIAAPLRKAGVFPPLAAHLLTVGEETGHLDEMFARMADIYENETRAAIRRFTSLFEPLVILVMGMMVGAPDSEHAARDYEHQRCGGVRTMNNSQAIEDAARPASP